MKKNGFTLAELVVALGVIGIITALIIPAAHKLMPDNNKVLYLKAYDTISTTIDGLKNNSKLYPICSKDNIDCASHPLFSNRKPLLAPFNAANDDRFEGKTKLCNLLAFSFDDLNNANCKSDRYTYDASTFDNNVSFVSKNGMQWIVSPYEYSYDSSRASFQTDIWVDINGSAEPNCIYSDACQKPDRFKFMVAADGTIVQADPKGIAYSNTRKTFTKNKADETINSTVIASTLSSTLASFTYGACGDVTQEPGKKDLKYGLPPGLVCKRITKGVDATLYRYSFKFMENFALAEKNPYAVLVEYEAKAMPDADIDSFDWNDYHKTTSSSTNDYTRAFIQGRIDAGKTTLGEKEYIPSSTLNACGVLNKSSNSVLFEPKILQLFAANNGSAHIDATNSIKTNPSLSKYYVKCKDLQTLCDP